MSIDSYSKEILEFEDGTEVEQYVIRNNQGDIIISIGGEQFTIDEAKLERTLRQRLRRVEINEQKQLKQIDFTGSSGEYGEVFDESSIQTTSTSGKGISASSIQTNSTSTFTHYDLANYETGYSSIPGTSSVALDPNWTNGTTDRLEVAASGVFAAYGNAQIVAWDTWTLSDNPHEISVEFNGSYSAAAVNAAGISDVQLQCFIASSSESNDDKVEKSNALYHGGFIADAWSDSGDFNVGLYESHYDHDKVLIGIHAKVKAAAASYSAGIVDAYTNDDFLSYDGYFNLDNYTVEFTDI